jgi:serine/threonine protein phosphatase PrpC
MIEEKEITSIIREEDIRKILDVANDLIASAIIDKIFDSLTIACFQLEVDGGTYEMQMTLTRDLGDFLIQEE